MAEETANSIRRRPVNGCWNSSRQKTEDLQPAADWNHYRRRRSRLERRLGELAQTYVTADRCALHDITGKLSLTEDRGTTDRVLNWDPDPNPNLDLP